MSGVAHICFRCGAGWNDHPEDHLMISVEGCPACLFVPDDDLPDPDGGLPVLVFEVG